MQRVASVLVMLAVALTLNACFSSVQWGPNVAINARATNGRINDGNAYTAANSQAMLEESRDLKVLEELDKYTQATLTWVKPTTIGRVVINAEKLEVFTLEAQIGEEWQVLTEVKNNLKQAWAYTLPKPLTVNALRVRIPRKYDTRRVGGGKRSTRTEGGMPSGEKKIYEFKAYAPPAATPEADAQ